MLRHLKQIQIYAPTRFYKHLGSANPAYHFKQTRVLCTLNETNLFIKNPAESLTCGNSRNYFPMCEPVNYQNISNFTHRHARYKPNEIAAVVDNEQLTWRQFDENLCKIAAGLQKLGIKKDDKVASVLQNGWPILELYWALPKIGAVFVPLSPLLNQDAIETTLNVSHCKLVVVDDEIVATKLLQSKTKIPTLQHVCAAKKLGAPTKIVDGSYDYHKLVADNKPLAHSERVFVRGDDLCHIFFSSGTTGQPKGICLSHAVRLDYAHQHSLFYRVQWDSVILHGGSMVFNGSMITMIPSFYHGCKFVMQTKYDPVEFMDLVEREGVTHCVLVPTQLVGLISSPKFDAGKLKTLKCVITVGAPLAVSHKRKFMKLLPGVLFELYGTTEGCQILMPPEMMEKKIDSVGAPPACTEIRIVDDQGNDVPTGTPGEIIGRGPLTFQGYYNEPGKTKESFLPGWWFKTGDIGYFDDDGYVYLSDRKKDMLIVGGVNVFPKDIEQIVVQYAGILECAIFGVPDEKWGEKVVAAITLKQGGGQFDAQKLIEWANGKVAKFQRIRDVIVLDEMPRNAGLKVLKRDLRDDYVKGLFKSATSKL